MNLFDSNPGLAPFKYGAGLVPFRPAMTTTYRNANGHQVHATYDERLARYAIDRVALVLGVSAVFAIGGHYYLKGTGRT